MGLLAWTVSCPDVARALTISGAVVDYDKRPLPGATLSLTRPDGAPVVSAVTSATGAYSFSQLAAGDYVVTPTLTDFSFVPASRSVLALSTDQPGQHFLGVRVGAHLTRSVVSGGQRRTFLVHVPPQHDAAKHVPLVIVLHGGGGDGRGAEMLTLGGLSALADREDFVVAYPDGIGGAWNDGRSPMASAADDVGFISALIDDVAKTDAIDTDRVYVTGISNGAKMANRLAADLSNKIAAVAPVCGQLLKDFALRPSRPVPVLLMQGDADPLNPYGGGAEPKHPQWILSSVADTVGFWVGVNRCSPIPATTKEPDRDPSDGTTVEKDVYAGCSGGAEVVLYTVRGGGHTWPGGLQYETEANIGKTSRDIIANEVMWAFFKGHRLTESLPGGPADDGADGGADAGGLGVQGAPAAPGNAGCGCGAAGEGPVGVSGVGSGLGFAWTVIWLRRRRRSGRA